MRVLILGYVGFGNVGDEALLAAELAALRRHLPDPQFLVISGDPAATQALHDVPACARTSPAALARAIRWCDVLVAGGGSLLQDVTSPRPAVFYGGLMLAAARADRLVVAYAQGLGPLRTRAARSVSARALRAAHYLSLRDTGSLELAEQLGVIGAEMVADPVLAMRPDDRHALVGSDRGWPGVGGRGRLAVAVRPWGRPDRWVDTLVDVLAGLTERVEPLLVPMHRGQDVDVAERLAGRLAARTGHVPELVVPDGGYAASIEALQSADVVVGMRLHALIAAAAAGVPVVPISYDPKVDAFARQVGVPMAGDVRALESVDGGARLRDAIKTTLDWDQVRRDSYRHRVDELALLADLPARRTAELAAGRLAVPARPGRMGA